MRIYASMRIYANKRTESANQRKASTAAINTALKPQAT